MFRLVLLFYLILFYSTTNAQIFPIQKADSFLNTLHRHNRFLGTVLVKKGDKIIYEKSIGHMDYDFLKLADSNTSYRIGSITNVFTAVMVMKAIEEGKLSLNSRLSSYFPAMPYSAKISIKQMLGHRSGIFSFNEDTSFLSWNQYRKTQDEMMRIIGKGKPKNPGLDSIFSYSNSNYVILSYILERAYQKSYSQILEDLIVKPLGLKNTHYGSVFSNTKPAPKSFTYMDQWIPEGETNASIVMGAGAIASSARDLSYFFRSLFAQKIIKQASLDSICMMRDNYGLGMMSMPYYEKIGYGHSGRIDGFSSLAVYYPKEDMTLVIASNGLNYEMNHIALGFLNGCFKGDIEVPNFNNFKVDPSDMESYLGLYAHVSAPTRITVTKGKNNQIKLQAEGQPAFDMDAKSLHLFQFEALGLSAEFYPIKNQLIIRQNGNELIFTKSK